MNSKEQRQPGRFDRLVEMLRTRNAKNNREAANILVRLGPPAVPLLVEEACTPGRRPDHRIRLLHVVMEIAAPLSAEDYYHVMQLGEHRVERVRTKAAEVLSTLHPDGPPRMVPEELMQAALRLHPLATAARALQLGQRHLRRQRRMPDGDGGQ